MIGWRWALGLSYIFAVAIIWIAASFVVQSVVDSGVSPFLVTYICNSLFIIYIPLVEIARYVEDTFGDYIWFFRSSSSCKSSSKSDGLLRRLGEESEENAVLLGENSPSVNVVESAIPLVNTEHGFELYEGDIELPSEVDTMDLTGMINIVEDASQGLDLKGRWTRTRTAKVSLLICPFWFFAQLCFNLSLKYTTVTSNTILSTASSLFTFFLSLVFLGEAFTWVKLISVLLCMGGTIIVSLGDSETGLSVVASKPVLGDVLALVSSAFYAVYITLIRKKIPDEDDKVGKPSMAQFLGFLGLFNLLLFLPAALILYFVTPKPFHALNWKQLGLIIGKGLLDNVLSDYLWAKAILLTSTTVATAGLTIQVPLAAIVDSVTGHAPHLMGYLGATAVMVGFAGINIPSNALCGSKDPEPVRGNLDTDTEIDNHKGPGCGDAVSIP
ncbi:hypothetical protein ACHQM5_027875 [Ranunculus cassubicifolius]